MPHIIFFFLRKKKGKTLEMNINKLLVITGHDYLTLFLSQIDSSLIQNLNLYLKQEGKENLVHTIQEGITSYTWSLKHKTDYFEDHYFQLKYILEIVQEEKKWKLLSSHTNYNKNHLFIFKNSSSSFSPLLKRKRGGEEEKQEEEQENSLSAKKWKVSQSLLLC